MSTSLPLSMLYLSLISCLAIFLTFAVVKIRLKPNVGLSDGDNETLIRQMRVQANLLENFLPFSILFILAELSSFSIIFLHCVGVIFLLARIAHAHGFSNNPGKSLGRYYGTLATWLVIILLIVINLYQSFMILLG
jgi:uncharacterized membrane protein YecN with MAPEG domain